MSKSQNRKKTRKQRRARNLTLPLVALGGLLLVIAFFLFANRGETYGGGTPALAVDQDKIDYGYVKFGENRQFKVKVTNTGDGLLRFKEKPYVEVLEGC
ncbi:MAG TPA: hypothetical protein VIV15_05485 [Anaerolineales bacterium]